MYLAAHRVLTPDRTHRGINVSYYTHDAVRRLVPIEWDKIGSWSPSVFDEITTMHPGHHVDSMDALPRGGNLVLSYLDVLAADSVEAAQLEAELDTLAAALMDEVGRVRAADHVAARFWVGVMLGPENLRLEFEALRAACLELRRAHPSQVVAVGA